MGKTTKSTVEVMILFFIMIVLVNALGSIIATNINFFQDSDTEAFQAVPFDISLSQDYIQSIINVSNGSVELPVDTNYTLNTTDILNPFVTILDNTSWTGEVIVEYEYRQGSYLTPIMAVLLGGLIIMIIIGAITIALKIIEV